MRIPMRCQLATWQLYVGGPSVEWYCTPLYTAMGRSFGIGGAGMV